MNGQTKIYQEKTETDEKDLRADSEGSSSDEEMEPEDKAGLCILRFSPNSFSR